MVQRRTTGKTVPNSTAAIDDNPRWLHNQTSPDNGNKHPMYTNWWPCKWTSIRDFASASPRNRWNAAALHYRRISQRWEWRWAQVDSRLLCRKKKTSEEKREIEMLMSTFMVAEVLDNWIEPNFHRTATVTYWWDSGFSACRTKSTPHRLVVRI